MNQPLVSVIIPTHNRPQFVGQALDSVFQQTYGNLEVIVVDDASDKPTQGVLKEYQAKEQRLHVIANKKNKGFVRSLNTGIKEAQGEYIARLDDDDMWCTPEKLPKQIAFLEQHRDYALVGGGIIRVDEQGKEISRQLLPETNEAIRRIMLVADPFVHPAVVFRARDIEAIGGYDETLDYAQDWDLWMKLGKYGKYYNFPEYFVRYLQSSQNRSNRNMRHHLWLNLVVRIRHKDEFPNFWKGYVLGWISYFFYFIPIRQRVSPWFLKIREWVVR